MYNLVMEIKRDLKRQMRQPKVNVWKELLDFWYQSWWYYLFIVIYIVGWYINNTL